MNPCDEEEDIEIYNYEDNDQLVDVIEPDFDDTNTHVPFDLSKFVSAESEIVITNAKMLETIKEVAEELLASSIIPFRRGDINAGTCSEVEIKAREKLASLGLKEDQINKLMQFEVKRLSPRKK